MEKFIFSSFCRTLAEHVSVKLKIDAVDYSNDILIPDDAQPKQWVGSLVSELGSISAMLDAESKRPTLCGTLDAIVSRVETRAADVRSFGYAGVQEFILDIHCLLKASKPFISADIIDRCNAVTDTVLKQYYQATSEERHSKVHVWVLFKRTRTGSRNAQSLLWALGINYDQLCEILCSNGTRETRAPVAQLVRAWYL